jgi:TusA-related sulfurtransferase
VRDRLDLSGVPCPQNTARALLKLELLEGGDEMEIIVDDGEPVSNMLAAFAIEPTLSVVEKQQPGGRGAWRVLVRKVE